MIENIPFTIICIYVVSICLSQLAIVATLKKIYHFSHNKLLTTLLIIIVSIIIACSNTYIQNLPAIYVLTFICEAFLLFFSFQLTLLQSYLCSCLYVFNLISLKGIVIGVISLVLKENSFQVLANSYLKYIAIIIVYLLITILFIIYRYKMNTKNIRNFLTCQKQLTLVLICHLTLTIFMLFNSFTFYYNLDLVWISVSQILTGLILGIAYMVVLNYGIEIADLLQHKLRDQKQLETIQYQLRQQNSILRIEEVINHFKHDYREQMLSIEYYLDNHLIEEAKKEVHTNYIQQLNSLPHTKKYCNNLLLNSLFVDRQSVCEENDIKMDVLLYFPPYLNISEKECHEVFRILTENAIEANEKIKDKKRYLKIKSEVEKNWLSIVIENPYQGIIHLDNGIPVSRELGNYKEGLGLIYIDELFKANNDMIQYKIDKENKIFKVMLLLHIDEER